MVTLRPFYYAGLGIFMLCLAFTLDSGEVDCGGRAMSPDQQCITTTFGRGSPSSSTRDYEEQRRYNQGAKIAGVILGIIFLLAGAGELISRSNQKSEKNSDRQYTQNTQSKTRRGNDSRYHLEVSFLEAIRGTTKHLNFLEGSAIEIAVPPGVENGYTVRLPGRGGRGEGNGKPGDAVIEISVKPHPRFERKGLDIWLDARISKYDAASGATIEVPTLDGYAKVRVPKATVSGQVLRLRGNGVMCAGSGALGHQFVRLAVKEAPSQPQPAAAQPQPQPAAAQRNDAVEAEFKNVFFNRTSADRERIISHWMKAKSVDHAKAMRLAIEDWRQDNRRTG